MVVVLNLFMLLVFVKIHQLENLAVNSRSDLRLTEPLNLPGKGTGGPHIITCVCSEGRSPRCDPSQGQRAALQSRGPCPPPLLTTQTDECFLSERLPLHP